MVKDDDKRLAAFKADSFGSDVPKNRVEYLTMTFLAIRPFDFSFSHIYWNMLYKLKSLSITLYALLQQLRYQIYDERIFFVDVQKLCLLVESSVLSPSLAMSSCAPDMIYDILSRLCFFFITSRSAAKSSKHSSTVRYVWFLEKVK